MLVGARDVFNGEKGKMRVSHLPKISVRFAKYSQISN